jgi:hypothetical protein
MSDQTKQLTELKQQILEQISEEELEAAVGARQDYYTINIKDLPHFKNPPIEMNTGVRYFGPLK